MMPNKQTNPVNPGGSQEPPWYKQFWPWFIIALPATVVVASFYTLWLAISNPDQLVVDDAEYRRLNSELKAQTPEAEKQEKAPDRSEPNLN